MAAKTPRKLAHDWSDSGRLIPKAIDIISTTRAWKKQIAVTPKATRYGGVSFEFDSEVAEDVGKVARGK